MPRVLIPVMAFALAVCVCWAFPAGAQTLRLTGADGREVVLTAAEIVALPSHAVELEAHGRRHVYEGPLLIDVLDAVGVPRGTALRGPALALAVVVSAGDGYGVVFGFGELDPGTRANRIILADRADGEPLGPDSGPFRLVAEGDLRPARSVRMVTAIRVEALSVQP